MNEYNINKHIEKKLANIFKGSERKETVVLDDGQIYLLKMPDPTREAHRSISYINNAVSEYLGCQILQNIGFNVQKTILGQYTVPNTEKTYVSCLCKNIVPIGYSLAEAESTSLGSEFNSKSAERPEFETLPIIADSIPDVQLDELEEWYSNLFVADALIGNTDRHNGNWGFLTGIEGTYIAPIYDCGSSLSPLLSDEELNIRTLKDQISNVKSVICDNGQRIKYKEYLLSCKNPSVCQALKRIVPRINIPDIERIIENTPYISDIRKQFYAALIEGRYEQILLPSLENVYAKDYVYPFSPPQNLYEAYNRLIKQFKDIEIDGERNIIVDGDCKVAKRVSNKYVLIYDKDTKESETIFRVRSNDKDVEKTIYALENYLERKITDISKDDFSLVNNNVQHERESEEELEL